MKTSRISSGFLGTLVALLAFSAAAQSPGDQAAFNAVSQQLGRAASMLNRAAAATEEHAKVSASGQLAVQLSADSALAVFENLSFDATGRYAVELWATRSAYSVTPSTFTGIPLGKKIIGDYNAGGFLRAMWTIIPFTREVPTGYYPTLLVTRDDGTNNWPYSLAITSGTALLEPNSLTTGVFEFYAPSLNHYFMTANTGESTNLANNPQLGWRPTGDLQIQFSRAVLGVAGTAGVCRFYGHPTIGPNSHFYTADVGECNFLRQLQASTPFGRPRWNYEEIAFASLVPSFGQCANGSAPIARFYNNGAAANDSNHRYVSTQTNFDAMVRAGWRNEGAVMCAPGASQNFDPALYR
jgi:hypothetical protein